MYLTSIRLESDVKLAQFSAILRYLESKFSAIYHDVKEKFEFKISYDEFEAEITFHGSCFNYYKSKVAPPPHQNYEY